MLIFILAACQSSSSNTDNSNSTDSSPTDTTIDDTSTDTTTDTTDTNTDDSSTDSTVQDSSSDSQSPYTKEQLENDPNAPSTDPRDYNADGQYVPHGGPSDNPAD
jgi:hypothetical protein